MRRKKKNIIIGMLCCMLVFMGVGYAAFQQALNIASTGSISSKWNIKITNVTEKSRNGYISDVEMSHDDTNANVSAVFQAPGDWIEFVIRVENQGTIDAILEEVKLTKNDNCYNEYIDVKISGIEAKEALNREESKEFIVRMEFDPNVTELPNQEEDYKIVASIGLKYVQKGSTTGSGSGSESTVCYNTNDDGSVTYNYACGTEVAVPATTEDGTPITTIDRTTFSQSNVTRILDYNEETGEERVIIAITDEENYDELKTSIEGLISGVSTSAILGKDVTPMPLNVTDKIGTVIEMSGSGSGSITTTYIVCRYSEVASLGLLENAEYYPGYYDIETQELYDPVSKITKLDLSQAINVTTIEESAFEDAPIKEIIFGDSITTIGKSSFEGSELETIIFGDNSNITTIGDYAFFGANLSGELIIPTSVITIGKYAFGGDSGEANQIGKLTFEEGSQLKTIGEFAFSKNHISGSLNLPDSLTDIGNGAFSSNMIEEVQLPSSLTEIKNNTFSNNQLSGELIIPASVTTIGNYVFGRDTSSTNKISKLTFEEGSKLTSIGNYAFAYNEISGELLVPSSVVTLGNSCFRESKINKLTFTEGSKIETIGEAAFSHNRLTGELVIPASVTTIGSGAFYGQGGDNPTNQISKLTFEEGAKLQTIDSYVFYGNNLTGELIIPASVTTIGEQAFSSGLFSNEGTNPISVLTFEEGSQISFINDYAFCNNLTLTTINTNMTDEEWNNRYLGTSWYGSSTPTIKYKEG